MLVSAYAKNCRTRFRHMFQTNCGWIQSEIYIYFEARTYVTSADSELVKTQPSQGPTVKDRTKELGSRRTMICEDEIALCVKIIIDEIMCSFKPK